MWSFQRVFEKDGQGNLKMGFNATLEIKCCQGLKLEGAQRFAKPFEG